jgi:formamidopyrimidine-DNA glycosylase
MPELPEVETVRRGLAATVVGRRLGPVVVTGARTVRRTSGDAVVEGLCGKTITSAQRRGKYLLLPLDSGQLLLIHLRMSGQLLLAPRDSPRPKHTHVAVGLDQDQELRFVDPRTFGEVVVVDPARLLEEAPGVALLGPDAWDDLGSARALAGVLSARSRALKPLLTDQRAVAGIGNIYSDEVLHGAGLSPWRLSSNMTPDETRRLHRSMRTILRQAIAARGSSLGDNQYVDLSGDGGSFQERHRVYGREGRPCTSCGRPVERVKWAGRSTFWCPTCQA